MEERKSRAQKKSVFLRGMALRHSGDIAGVLCCQTAAKRTPSTFAGLEREREKGGTIFFTPRKPRTAACDEFFSQCCFFFFALIFAASDQHLP